MLSGVARTKDNESSVRVRGAKGILGRAAVHGAVELGWDPLQNQLLSLPLGAPVQETAPDPRPGEEGLGEHLILSRHGAQAG